ncbi:MAG: shikimate kinase [Microbacteriaceae bacterium]|jgi:shikimate kinase|nr:shikimate kinase [Microbacteriaceae bacterium]
MTAEAQPYLVLIGPPAAGKTRLGKRVARLLKVPFVDTDRRIVARYGAIPEIFRSYGEAHYRELERAEVSRALAERAVVALGGGAIVNLDTQRDLASLRVALITVSEEAVASRILGSSRPLVSGIEGWSKLVEGRREIYERLATRAWDTSNRPIDHVANELAAWITEETPAEGTE